MLWDVGDGLVKGPAEDAAVKHPFSLPAATAGPVQWALLRLALLRHPVVLGVRVILLDGEDRVFLVRHSYLPGWHFPGGGVERQESIRTAALREVREEAGLAIEGTPVLLGLYLNGAMANRNHVAVFVARAFAPLADPGTDWEIAERGFFPVRALPEGTTPGTRARLAEVLDAVPPRETW